MPYSDCRNPHGIKEFGGRASRVRDMLTKRCVTVDALRVFLAVAASRAVGAAEGLRNVSVPSNVEEWVARSLTVKKGSPFPAHVYIAGGPVSLFVSQTLPNGAIAS